MQRSYCRIFEEISQKISESQELPKKSPEELQNKFLKNLLFFKKKQKFMKELSKDLFSKVIPEEKLHEISHRKNQF